MESVKTLLKKMTLEEKIALVSGTDFMYTNAIKRLNVPAIRMSDGPHGLRVQKKDGDNGVTGSEPATAFPTAAMSACSWDTSLLFQMGEALGKEAQYYDIDVILGPGMNIKRNPLAGRNFEYFSEDPFLTGTLAASEVEGIQSKGIGVSLKHFALNNAENYRFMGNSVCDERTIRDIYLKPFEMVVKKSNPETIMAAYNQINGVYCSENYWLLHDVLRKEWGYNGIVMTDWGATHDRVKMIQAGCDLEMPGDTAICRKWLFDAVQTGKLKIDDLDQCVLRILRLISLHSKKKKEYFSFEEHHDLSAKIAINSAVLLKNNGVLPLSNQEKILVVGELFEKMRYQGSGSSMICPYYLTTPKDAFEKNKVSFQYIKGYYENQIETDKILLKETIEVAQSFETIVVFAGLTDYVESEGADRNHLRLPQNQLEIINSLIALNKKVVIVLYGGSVVELPFADQVEAILNMMLPGQNGGTATYNLLYGLNSPSGKLAETWVESYQDVPYGSIFSQNALEIYKESIFVGYRYYLTTNKKVRYPFGYGLTYTKFRYQKMNVELRKDEYIVSCVITNIGSYAAAEIVELYVESPKTIGIRASRELKGFSKIFLNPGESGKVTIILNKDELKYFNIKEKRSVIESGDYQFMICSDANTIQLSTTITIIQDEASCSYSPSIIHAYQTRIGNINDEEYEEMSGLKIPYPQNKKVICLESRFSELQQTFMGRILYNSVLSVANKSLKKAKRMPLGQERDNQIKGAIFLKRILESNSIITMSMSAGKSFPYTFAQGFVHLANGHILRGIKSFCTSIKAPKLPKEEK